MRATRSNPNSKWRPAPCKPFRPSTFGGCPVMSWTSCLYQCGRRRPHIRGSRSRTHLRTKPKQKIWFSSISSRMSACVCLIKAKEGRFSNCRPSLEERPGLVEKLPSGHVQLNLVSVYEGIEIYTATSLIDFLKKLHV